MLFLLSTNRSINTLQSLTIALSTVAIVPSIALGHYQQFGIIQACALKLTWRLLWRMSLLLSVEKLGIEWYKLYHERVIKDQTTSIHEVIKKNSLSLFSCPKPKTKSKHGEQITMLRHDVELFSRLYIVMQRREGDMSTFFMHVNHPYPPSLYDRGKLRLRKKSDLVSVLPAESEKEAPVVFDVKILDGAAIVHLLPTNGVRTFDDYSSDVFIPYVKK